MKRSTALRHVKELAATAQRQTEMAQEVFPPLSELWLGGDILEGAESVDWVLIVVRLDLPDDDLPYLALHPAITGWTSWLRLDKLPIDAHWRSRQVPAWDHTVTHVARFWSAATGTDELMIRRLEDRTVPDEMIESTTPHGLRAALQAALPRSERHLTEVLEGYWTRDWRRLHQGNGIYPEDHLWRAAEAVQSIRNALDGKCQ